MKANKTTISVGDTIIFYCDEYQDGNIMKFYGSVQSINDKGVDVLYLSGYRPRNDFILFKDIIAKPLIPVKGLIYVRTLRLFITQDD